MKKLLSILGAMTLIGTTSTGVVACGDENPTSPTPDTRTDLSTIITKTNLDKIEMVGTVPTKEELLKAINSKNVSANTLSENDFDFEGSPTATTATIEGKTNYKGKITLTYKKDTRTDLSTITQLTELDITADTTVTNFELWKKIKTAHEFINKQNIFSNSWTFEVRDALSKKINNEHQKSGIIYVIIAVSEKNLYWKGTTPPLKVTLK